MREYKFRGKKLFDNRDWVYGDLIHRFNNWTYIAPIPSVTNIELIEVDNKTVGQYTGLKDKNGKEIYEGDIIKLLCDCCKDKNIIAEVKFFRSAWRYFTNCNTQGFMTELAWEVTTRDNDYQYHKLEVIGNIYDNPELLKEVE